MPYPNEHSARMAAPEQFDRFVRKNDAFGPGIDAIFGVSVKNGKTTTTLQAIRFDKRRFSAAEARKWLADNGKTPLVFEAARQAESYEFKGRRLGSSIDFSKVKYVDRPDGSVLFKNVLMLGEGTWTDSAVGTPLHYPAKALEKFALNWKDRTGWSRHRGGAPRDITDKVSSLEDVRYDTKRRGIVGDILVHGQNSKSADLIKMMKAGLADYVSVEHRGREQYNPDTHQMEAATLEFDGYAHVNKGACGVCTIRSNAAAEIPLDAEAYKQLESDSYTYNQEDVELEDVKLEAVREGLSKELEAREAKYAKSLSDVEEKLGRMLASNADVSKMNTELIDRLAEADKTVKALSEENKKLISESVKLDERVRKLEMVKLDRIAQTGERSGSLKPLPETGGSRFDRRLGIVLGRNE